MRRPTRVPRPAVVAAAALALVALSLLGTSLLGQGSSSGADLLLNVDPWRATASADADPTTAPVSDTVDARLPRLEQFGDGVRAGELRTWNPWAGGGTGQHVDAFAVTELPYLLLGSENATAWSTLLALAISVAGTIAYLRLLGVGGLAAVTGAAVFALSGYQIVWTIWPQSHVGALVPALFWAVERQVQRPGRRSVAAIAVVTAAMLVEGFPAVAVVVAAVAGLYGVARILLTTPAARDRVRRLGGAAVGALTGIAIAGVAIVPLADELRRADLDRSGVGGRTSAFVELATAVSPDVLGPPDGPYHGPSNYIEAAAHVGVAALVLAAVALAARSPGWPRGVRAMVGGGVAITTLLVFVDGPHVDLVTRLPVLSSNPLGRYRVLLAFFVAVASAMGVDVLVRRGVALSGRALVAAGTVATGVGLLLVRSLVDRRDETGGALELGDDVVRVGVLSVLAIALVFAARRWHRPTLAVAGLTALVLAEGAVFAHGWMRVTPDDEFFPSTQAHAYLAAELDGQRFGGTGGSLMPGTGTWYGLRDATGNIGHLPEYADVLRVADPDVFVTGTYSRLGGSTDVLRSPALDRLAVRYLSYPVGVVPGRVIAPPASDNSLENSSLSNDAVEIAVGRPAEVPWEGPARAVVLVLADDLVSDDPWAEVTIEVVDADGAVVGEGRRRVFHGIPAGELTVPFTTPPPGTVPATVRIGVAGPTTTVALEARSGTPIAGWVTGDPDYRVVLADGITLVERPDSLPRVRWAATALVVDDPTARLALLADGLDADTAIVESATATDGAGATIDVVQDDAERIEVTVGADGAGLLVVADAIHGSWTATVDGRPVPLERADHAGVAVALPAGDHVVVLRPDDGPLRTGALATAAGILLLGVLVAAPPRVGRRLDAWTGAHS